MLPRPRRRQRVKEPAYVPVVRRVEGVQVGQHLLALVGGPAQGRLGTAHPGGIERRNGQEGLDHAGHAQRLDRELRRLEEEHLLRREGGQPAAQLGRVQPRPHQALEPVALGGGAEAPVLGRWLRREQRRHNPARPCDQSRSRIRRLPACRACRDPLLEAPADVLDLGSRPAQQRDVGVRRGRPLGPGGELGPAQAESRESLHHLTGAGRLSCVGPRPTASDVPEAWIATPARLAKLAPRPVRRLTPLAGSQPQRPPVPRGPVGRLPQHNHQPHGLGERGAQPEGRPPRVQVGGGVHHANARRGVAPPP
mmetsp:Transcript_16132/g.52569  ORF Transcript_16132/g.52569 Transcript_16132/m.52569 type:complete len:309 (-) Transcript_16132:147-1073(-)